jgi:hypothetical protein
MEARREPKMSRQWRSGPPGVLIDKAFEEHGEGIEKAGGIEIKRMHL